MGKLTNLNPPAEITDADIPASIARDSEIAAAIANASVLVSRTSSASVNANTALPQGKPISMRWIDQQTTHTNFPADESTGTLVQFDSLVGATSTTNGSSIENKYRCQLFWVPTAGNCKLYYRAEQNGVWSNSVLA